MWSRQECPSLRATSSLLDNPTGCAQHALGIRGDTPPPDTPERCRCATGAVGGHHPRLSAPAWPHPSGAGGQDGFTPDIHRQAGARTLRPLPPEPPPHCAGAPSALIPLGATTRYAATCSRGCVLMMSIVIIDESSHHTAHCQTMRRGKKISRQN